MKKVGETGWENARRVYLSDGTLNIALLNYKTEEAAGKRGRDFVGEPSGGSKFYEVKYHDPDGIAFDITANGWAGAAKESA